MKAARCFGRSTAWLAMALLSLACLARAEAPLVLAVYPFASPPEIEKRFAPLADVLSTATGRPVSVRIARDYEQHIDFVGRDAVDLAYVGPASLIAIETRFGRKPLLGRLEANGRSEMLGVIVVRDSSPIRTLTDLRGRRLVFVDRHSTVGYLAQRAMMRRAGVVDSDLGGVKFAGSYDNAAIEVLTGEADAGAVRRETFEQYAGRGLRVVAETPAVADHAFIASPGLPTALRETMQQALFDLNRTAAGRAALAALRPGVSAIIPATYADYESLRRLLTPPASAGAGGRKP